MKITDIDKNFVLPDNIQREGAVFHRADELPFSIHGVFWQEDRYTRLPREIAESVSETVAALSTNTAGGRVRFSTDSPYIIVRAELPKVCKMSHMAFSGIYGIDVYTNDGEGDSYLFTVIPPTDAEANSIIQGVFDLPDRRMRTFTLNMPLYNDMSNIYVGLAADAHIEGAKYKIVEPVVYYGSSVTQGGCASRPGMSYQSILSRWLDADYINLGFSGSARGEKEMAEYIAGLKMSAFVLDYDYNAPSAEHLEVTHERFYRIVRAAHPDLPILLLSSPWNKKDEQKGKRLQVIKSTYSKAVNEGDKNVYFINGAELFSDRIGHEGTVDGCHPTDLGFFSMAERIYPVLKEMLGNYSK